MTPSNTGVLIGQTLGDYELLSLLGAGGMAEVYRARDVALGREVAVKVLPASLATDPGYVERFRDEARRVATLDHLNVVPVYHYGEEHGLLYLVMPILKESLRDRMVREGILPPSEAGRIVVQVAAALDTAHQHGIVHRDVKPENILLNAEGKAHLTDFGIAREVEFLRQTGHSRTLASSGLPVGTPEYMAPEQLRGGIVDQRADIYALGAVLYELLTGMVPFDGPTPYEVAALVLTAQLPPPSTRNSLIWPDLDYVVMKALERDAEGRYPDARSMAIALRDAVLHSDKKMTRVTIPASSYLKRVVAAQGPVMSLPTSGPLEGAAAAALPLLPPKLNLPSTVTGNLPSEWATSIPVAGGMGGKGGQIGARRAPQRRTWLFVSAAALLVVLLIGTGWSVGILQGLLTSTGAASLPGIGGLIATETPNATETAGPNGISTTTTKGTPGTSGGPTNVPNPQATATPTSQPTATTPPSAPSLVVNPSPQWTLGQTNHNKTCSGQQFITNIGSNAVQWSWQSTNPDLSSNGNFIWGVNSPAPTPGTSGLPSSSSLTPNATDTVSVTTRCNGTNYAVRLVVTDLVTNLQTIYTFSMHA